MPLIASMMLVCACDWTGSWSTDYGIMYLNQIEGDVAGTYRNFMGEGQIQGVAYGNTLIGNWTERGKEGPIDLIITDNCSSFHGYWQYQNGPETWNGTRIIDYSSTRDTDQDDKKMESDMEKNRLREEYNITSQQIDLLDQQINIEDTDSRISAAFRAGKISLSFPF
jgi:hypothetical protein